MLSLSAEQEYNELTAANIAGALLPVSQLWWTAMRPLCQKNLAKGSRAHISASLHGPSRMFIRKYLGDVTDDLVSEVLQELIRHLDALAPTGTAKLIFARVNNGAFLKRNRWRRVNIEVVFATLATPLAP